MLLAVIFRFVGILTHRRDWDFPHTTSSASTRLSTALQDYVDWTIKPEFWRNPAIALDENAEPEEQGNEGVKQHKNEPDKQDTEAPEEKSPNNDSIQLYSCSQCEEDLWDNLAGDRSLQLRKVRKILPVVALYLTKWQIGLNDPYSYKQR